MGRWGPALLIAVVACGLVALSARGVGLLHPPAELTEGWVMAVRALGLAAVVAGLAGLPLRRPEHSPRGSRGPDPAAAAGGAAAGLMVALTLLALFAPRLPVDSPGSAGTGLGEEGTQVNPEAGGPPPSSGTSSVTQGFRMEDDLPQPVLPSSEAAQAGGPEPGAAGGIDLGPLRRIARGILLLMLLALVAWGTLAWRIRRRVPFLAPVPDDDSLSPEEVALGLEASLAEVTARGSAPRHQITSAYHRLLEALVEAGATREPQEAPHEHLHRVLGPLGIHPEPMHRLTALYVVAQFGEQPVTEVHRAAAAEALEVSLAALREARLARASERVKEIGGLAPSPQEAPA